MKNMKNKYCYYKGLDRVIAKCRQERKMRAIKEGSLSVAKFIGCAVIFYGTIFFTWCALCATFPTWP